LAPRDRAGFGAGRVPLVDLAAGLDVGRAAARRGAPAAGFLAGDFFGAAVVRLTGAAGLRAAVVFFGAGREVFFAGFDAVRELGRAGAAAFLAAGRAVRWGLAARFGAALGRANADFAAPRTVAEPRAAGALFGLAVLDGALRVALEGGRAVRTAALATFRAGLTGPGVDLFGAGLAATLARAAGRFADTPLGGAGRFELFAAAWWGRAAVAAGFAALAGPADGVLPPAPEAVFAARGAAVGADFAAGCAATFDFVCAGDAAGSAAVAAAAEGLALLLSAAEEAPSLAAAGAGLGAGASRAGAGGGSSRGAGGRGTPRSTATG
jgi:hypothetical protein